MVLLDVHRQYSEDVAARLQKKHKKEAQEKAKREAQEKAMKEAEETAKREAEEKAEKESLEKADEEPKVLYKSQGGLTLLRILSSTH